MQGVPNFQRVSDRLYRGGQPTPEGLVALKQLGIRTVVDLRDRTGMPSAERKQALALGLHYHRIPLGKVLGFARGTMDRILRILGDPESGPVYVHCRRGCDRTGAVIACHRIANEGWTAEEAIAEARKFGMAKLVFLNRVFIRLFYRSLAAKA